MPRGRARITSLLTVLVAAGTLVAAACTQSSIPPSSAKPVAPVTVQQSSAPAAPAIAGGAPAVARPAGPAAGPNLLAKTWSERLAVTVSELKPATGKKLLDPKPGDLYFFSNSSTAWGATNLRNSVWVIDAKTKKTVLEVAPFDGEGYSSHGITVSADGKFVYLPMLGKDNHFDVLDGRTFEVVQTIRTLARPHHMKLWRDPATNKDYVLGEDFNWNFAGSGVYVFDPSQNNAVVGGMSRGDFSGNPYVTATTTDGKYVLVTVPAAMSSMRDRMDGYLAKVDPKTWTVIGMTPMIDPLYPASSLDSKFAYVTSGAMGRIYKVDLNTMEIVKEVQTGPGPWGMAVGYDGSKLYTADKGEGPGYNQQGRTSTIIDAQTMGVSNAVPIGLTTDHVLLSPDGKEVWYTSNAEHNIHVYDTATEKEIAVIQDPADGDIHGGVWVQYTDDGKGGVKDEVVADYNGLHGSALKAQLDYAATPTLQLAINNSGFLQKSIGATAGQAYRVVVKNVAGTSSGRLTFTSKEFGADQEVLLSGQSKEYRWTAPSAPTAFKATTNKTPNGDLTIQVAAKAAASPAPAAGGPAIREIAVEGSNFLWTGINGQTIDIKPGETVSFVLTNKDDEKHNIVGLSDAGLLSPDVAPGAKVTYKWTAPSSPQTFKVICAYHPLAVFTISVK